ncbi:MAG: enoyl-CoA hydratase [Candidatus Marinimicrobia bacterium]|nr:enoyl-CoA hydratase [Candidatus Neomarinimicrobiota bacterium]
MSDIEFKVKGSIGHILLNRPKALNALTLDMCERLFPKLQEWAVDDMINAVIIRGAGKKAFCAGGDVIRLYEDGSKGGAYPRIFYNMEYRCNALIKNFPKPYIALIDGIVMGGGVGVSVHGSYRIVTERTVFAMPETGIGLFPDVGGTWFLPRLRGSTGMYLGLTGRRLKGAECVALGLAEAFVPSNSLDDLEAKLVNESPAELSQIVSTVKNFAMPEERIAISAERPAIDKHFGLGSVEKIIGSLESDGSEWAKTQVKTLRQKSPLSLKITFRQLCEGAALQFEDCMRLEWRLANRFATDFDFYEGVRALLVDKDMNPQWSPATLADVTDTKINTYFESLPGNELDLNGIVRGN